MSKHTPAQTSEQQLQARLSALEARIHQIAVATQPEYPNIATVPPMGQLWAIGTGIEGIEAANADLHSLVADLLAACEATGAVDEDDCQPDHHGLCQTHSLQPVGQCWVRLVRDAIAKTKEKP